MFHHKSSRRKFISRTNFLIFITYILGALICGRLFLLTVIKHDIYLAQSINQEKFARDRAIKRGEIYLKDWQGQTYPIAINKGWPMAYAEPNRITENKRSLAHKIAKILDLEETIIFEKISDSDDPFKILKRKLNEEETQNIKALNAEGIKIQTEESLRYYPANTLASHVIGFLGHQGDKRVGQYGIEEYYDKALSGKIINADFSFEEQIESGYDIMLSLDPNIQLFVEEGLKKNVEQYNASEGTVIVMNPKTGMIVAMANYPNFDPNKYSEVDNFNIFINKGISSVFEPGSVFKPITMAIALDEGAVTPASTYQDKGFVKMGGYTIYNADKKIFGEQTMTQVLEKSINTGIVYVESLLKQDIIKTYLNKFGFGHKTGIKLPNEASGNLDNLDAGRSINFATAAFGQGISVTAIQLVKAFGIIANKGVLVNPIIVESIEKNGKIQESINEKNTIQEQSIISPDTANRLTAMLVSVTENGTGKRAKIPGYWIATKTGTAQIPGKGGYGEDTIHTVIGFGPAYDAEFVVLVKLNRPQEVRFAAVSVAPLFRDIAEYLLNYWEIAPEN
jgi:cell division protein FtsI/penicillin-binding protein 2